MLRPQIVVHAIVILIILLSAKPAPAQTRGTDFNNGQIWRLTTGGNTTASPLSDRVDISLPTGGLGGSGVQSVCYLAGDFDVQVDYILTAWLPNNGSGLFMQLDDLGFVNIGRSSDATAGEIYTGGRRDATTDRSGTLRLVRNGSTISGYYLQSGSWVLNYSTSLDRFSQPSRLSLSAGRSSAIGPTTQASFLNFRANSGATCLISTPGPTTCSTPTAPSGLTGILSGSTITLTWGLSSGSSSYVLDAGSSQGRSDVVSSFDVGNTGSYVAPNIGAGTYYIRVRARNACGNISTSSNEVTVFVGGTPRCEAPSAPLLATPLVVGSAVTLNWSSSPTATSYVIEAGSASGLADIVPPADTNSSSTVYANQDVPAGTYFVRIRAKNTCGISVASNERTIVVNTKPSVFLIHGIGQGPSDIADLAANLQNSLGHDYTLDSGYDYSGCGDNPSCSQDCTIQNQARVLGAYIRAHAANGAGIVLVGYSLGGLIARDLILNNYGNTLQTHHVLALVTLGTPNLGYPYSYEDDTARCPVLGRQMFGDFRNDISSIRECADVSCHDASILLSGHLVLSTYLIILIVVGRQTRCRMVRHEMDGWQLPARSVRRLFETR